MGELRNLQCSKRKYVQVPTNGGFVRAQRVRVANKTVQRIDLCRTTRRNIARWTASCGGSESKEPTAQANSSSRRWRTTLLAAHERDQDPAHQCRATLSHTRAPWRVRKHNNLPRSGRQQSAYKQKPPRLAHSWGSLPQGKFCNGGTVRRRSST